MSLTEFRFCTLFILLLYIQFVNCHVRLTYPPARYPPLDFLDNTRTVPPCGVPRQRNDQGTKTTLKAGTTFNLTWSLTYPHQGGFRIELLDEADNLRDILTPNRTEYISDNDPTSQTYRITLPDKPCRNCVVRLVRQAVEWGNYKFWSCADVDIETDPTERCSNRGANVNGQCQCERLYNGDVCQYEDECLNDKDCGGNGKCVELDTFTYPKRLCYCRPGWFGTGCQQVSKLKDTQFDASLYQYKNLGDGENKLYWRILKESNEIEFVMQYYGKSWIAVGWKPKDIDPKCANLNSLASRIYSKSFTEPEQPPHVLISSTVTSATVPGNGPEKGSTDSSTTSGTIRPSTITMVPVQSGGFNIVPSLNATGAKGAGIVVVPPATVSQEPTTDKGVVVSGLDSDVSGENCYGDWRWPPNCRDCDYRLSWTYVEEFDEMEFSLETRVPANWWSGVGFSKIGKMSDSDMIIIKSMDSKITVQDMYSKGYTAPSLDEKQDIGAPSVIGTHINGVLRAAFSRSRQTSDKTNDSQFSDEDCFYFLFPVSGGRLDAKGQMAQHLDTPKVSKQKICVKPCPKETTQVSAAGIPDSSKVNSCQKEFKFPAGCQLPACDYYAAWKYDLDRDMVNFQISSRELGRWTGIGFSSSGNMTNSDMIVGWVYDNGTFVTDRFAYGKHMPAIDRHQDVQDIRGRIDDDVQTLYFSRKLETDDVTEDVSLLDCLYYLFPVGGGRVLAKSDDDLHNSRTPIGFHDLYVPKVSKIPICICTDDGYPVFSLNETAVKRQKRSARATTTTEDYDEDYDGTTTVTPKYITPGSTKGKTELKTTTNIIARLPTKEPVAQPQPKPEPEPKPTVPQTLGNGLSGEFADSAVAKPAAVPASASAAGLHPMDCTDVVVGSAVDGFSKIEDMYTVSRATPMVDEVYGGRQSITAATGYEENDVTTIIFRKPLTTRDVADHSIFNGAMTVIWAKGQSPDQYSHSPKSGLEVTNDNRFYTPDVLAYHGNVNRGVFTVNFFDKSEPDPKTICRGEQTYPPGCSLASCLYNVSWVKVAENLNFILDVKLDREKWTGIGFSKDGAMAKSDAIIIQVNPTGPIEVTDRFMPGYTRPVVDRIQNIFNVDARYINGRMSASFTRTLVTDDSKEDLDLNECFFFLYPFKGGSAINGEIQKHNDTPGRSEQICFSKCVQRPVLPSKKPAHDVDVASSPLSKKYLLILKLTNHDWSDDLFDVNSEKYKALSNKIISVVDNALASKFKGYQKAEINKFRPGSVLAEVTVTAGGIKDQDIVDVIQPLAKAGLVQGLRIDPDVITVQEIKTNRSPEEIRNYVIIAIACFVVVVAVISAICLILYLRKRKTKRVVKTSSNRTLVPFSPYSYLMTNGKYPSPYQYPNPNGTTHTDKKSPYDGRSYHMDYGQSQRVNGFDSRKQSYSTMTMTTQNDNNSSLRGQQEEKRGYVSAYLPPHNLRRIPSRTTDTNNYSSHQGKPPATHYHQPAGQQPPNDPKRKRSQTAPRPGYYPQDGYGTGGPYVQYPNEPHSYYTMNGVNRVHSTPRGGGGHGYYGHY